MVICLEQGANDLIYCNCSIQSARTSVTVTVPSDSSQKGNSALASAVER